MPSWKKLIVSGSDASLSSLTTTGKLQLNSSETGSTIFEVNGVNGRLFTITDEMSGSLFNISTTAGLPVIEALSDGKVTLGPFSAQTEINTSGNLELGGNISGSATSTGSFGHLLVGGSELASSPDATDGSQSTISGSATSTGSFGLSRPDTLFVPGFYGPIARLGIGNSFNLFVGDGAGAAHGLENYQQGDTGFGAKALFAQTSQGAGNVAIGNQALRQQNSSVGRNTALGTKAGDTITTGYRNVYLGWEANASSAGAQSEIVIGYSAVGKGNSTTVIGNNDHYLGLTGDAMVRMGSISGSSGVVEIKGNISGSATSTGSFGSVMQNGKHFPQVNSIGESFAFGTNAGSAFLGDSVNRINIAIGSNAGTAMADYGGNVYIGKNAAKLRTRGDSNVCIGPSAGGTDGDDFGDKNVFIGLSTGLAINSTNSDSNVFIGNLAGTAGQQSIANVLIGDRAGNTLTDSSRNVAIGIFAGTGFGVTNTTTENGVYIGQYARTSATNANNEIVIGSEAVGHGTDTITFGDNQITDVYFASGSSTGATFHGIKDFAGNISGSATSTGSFGVLKLNKFNAGIGDDSNINIGEGAGSTGDSATNNIAIGFGAGAFSNAGSFINIAIGREAQGHWTDADGDRNIAIGYQSMYDHNGGDDNIAIGYQAMKNGEGDGSDNIAIGTDAMQAIGAGASRNIGMGDRVMHNLVGGTDNVGFGKDVLFNNEAGDYNVGIGTEALNQINAESADKNVAVGYRAGKFITDGSTGFSDGDSNVFIGSETKPAADDESNQIIIGANAIGKGSNTALIGDDNITDIYMSEDLGATVHTGQIIASGSANATDTIKIYGDASGNVGHAGITFDLDNTTDDAEAYLRLDRTAGTKYLGLTMQSDGRDGMRFMTGTTERLRINSNDVSGSGASIFSVGSLQTAGNITPKTDDSVDLGAADKRFSNIFTTDLQLSNEGKDKGNEVDGTTGSWTIQEGEEELYLLNRKNGKKYKFMLQEIK